ncbi:MAG: hypothetical protein M1833_001783 [Piccolia ochrophora]|nr:MAG: hypothetical protein M1833_001783 [Piccolia ochrophora]
MSNIFRNPSLVVRAGDDDPKPSDYPYGDAFTNEFKWLNWDKEDEDHKKDAKKIHDAFGEWRDLVKEGAVAAADKDGAIFKRWFGKQDDPDEIKNVFGNMWSGSSATKEVKEMVCDRKDFKDSCTKNPTWNAYTMADTGHFHICPKGMKGGLASENKCGDLDDSCSSKMRSLSLTLLHEMTHYNRIGSDARGEIAVIDVKSGAYDCFKLSNDDKGDNAQNYAWLAADAYYSKTCDKTFKDPEVGVKTTSDYEDVPEQGTTARCFHKPLSAKKIKVDPKAAREAVHTFCSKEVYRGKVIVPSISFGTGLTSDKRQKVLGMSDPHSINGGDNTFWTSLSFSEGDCMGMFQFDVGKDEKESVKRCEDRFEPILRCPMGGSLDDVCAIYRVGATDTAYEKDEMKDNPFELKSSKDIGKLTCEET